MVIAMRHPDEQAKAVVVRRGLPTPRDAGFGAPEHTHAGNGSASSQPKLPPPSPTRDPLAQASSASKPTRKSTLLLSAKRAIRTCGLAGTFLLQTCLPGVPAQAALTEDFESYFNTGHSFGHIMVHNADFVPNRVFNFSGRTVRLNRENSIRQEFTTGSHPPGYRVTLLQFFAKFNSQAKFDTQLFKGTSLVDDLTNPDARIHGIGDYTWWHSRSSTPSASGRYVNLQPNTTYTFYTKNVATVAVNNVEMVTYSGTDELGDAGWSIANTSSHTASASTDVNRIVMTVWGMPRLGAPRNLSFGDIDDSTHDVTLRWDQVEHAGTAKVEHYRVETCVSGCQSASGWSKLSDVSTEGVLSGQSLRYTHDGGASELLRRYRVKAYNGRYWAASEELAIPTQTTGAEIVSTPASANTYRRGEVIEIAVNFSRAVTVEGEPKLHLAIGDDTSDLTKQTASYNRSSKTTQVIFRYTVAADIVDTTGLQLHRSPLEVNRQNRS